MRENKTVKKAQEKRTPHTNIQITQLLGNEKKNGKWDLI